MTAAEHLGGVLRGLAAGVEPGRLLVEALNGAVVAAHARQGMVMGLVDGAPIAVASTGTMPSVVRQAAEDAISTGRTARRLHAETGSGALAEPVRAGARIVGAIAVGGDPGALTTLGLSSWSDVIALTLGRVPTPASGAPSAIQVMDAMADVGSDLDHAGIVNRSFAAARGLFGAQGGLYMLIDDDRARIAHVENIDLEALRAVATSPAFRTFVASPALNVAQPGHPAMSRLVQGAETAVALPLESGGRRLGHLLLIFGVPVSAQLQSLLVRFASQVAHLLRASDLSRRVVDGENRLAAVAHTVAEPVIVVDDENRLLLVNAAAAELFHLPGMYIRGERVQGKLGDETLETLLCGEDEGQVEVALGVPEPHVYLAAVRRIVAPTGALLGKVLALRDITVQHETARIKDDFVAVIGHELRTPLTIVKGYVHMLGRKGPNIEAKAWENALSALQSNTVRLERLIEDLLFVSAVESNATVDLAPTDIGEVVDGKAGGRVVVKRPSNALVVPVDPAKLDQVLHHLLDNALKYAEGEVLLEVIDKGEEVEVAVEDHGPGIFSGDLPHLFERFRQLDGSATRSHGGTGLGLYICRRLVELLGGRIWVESRLGVGSRFAFTLPKEGALREATPERGGFNPLGNRNQPA
ncbi:MAG: sensor histidine kinase [Acidimicrobiia bacterium]